MAHDPHFSSSQVAVSSLDFRLSIRRLLNLFILIITVLGIAAAQDLPKKIRGYKVQIVKVHLNTSDSRPPDPEAPAAHVNIKNIKLADYSVMGITLKMPVELRPVNGAGKVDFMTFHDFSLDGTPIEIQEFQHAFSFENGQPIALPEPVTAFVRTDRVITTAWKETRDNRPEWTITGRAFVFGRFRKYGMHFKRVIPIDVAFTIPNPLYKPKKPGQ